MGGKTKNWGDLVGSLFFILIGAAVMIGAIKLKVGTPTNPQPGFFPFLGALVVVTLASFLLMRALLGKGKGAEAFGEVGRPALMVIGIAVYSAILDPLGYVPATVLLSVVLLRVLGVKSWRAVVVSSIALAAGSYLLFARLLGVELPAGVFEFLG